MSATYIAPASLPALRPLAGARPAQPDEGEGYRLLAAAVLAQAVKDLRLGSGSCARQVRAGGLGPWLERLWLDEGAARAVEQRLEALAARVGEA